MSERDYNCLAFHNLYHDQRHMWQKQQKYSPIVCLALLLALASTPIAATLLMSQFAVAQQATKEPTFPLPNSVSANTIVRIDGSSSMARINESLKQSFEQQFNGAKVELATSGTDAALTSLADGKIDLAAIGRGLTPAEEAKGLEQKRLRREKIAIVVGEKNPFKGNITNQQFAKIFRGEITNWSQLDGKPGKIRFIDRPNNSDTREAFRNYPAFKDGKFATGSNATQLSADDSAELVKQLGNDGIGYVIANQVSKVPGLRVLPLHQTLPNDPKYPFSQPLVYVYKKNPSPSVAGFLGFATAEPGTKAVETARSAEAAAVAQSVASTVSGATTAAATPTPSVTSTPETTTNQTAAPLQTDDTTSTPGAATSVATVQNNTQVASEPTQTGGFPWWILLPLAALGGGILWWLLGKGNKRSEALEGASTLPIAGASDSNVNLSPTPQASAILSDSTNNTPENTNTNPSNAANLAGGAALAGAATGIGLWPRLAGGNIEEPSINTPEPQTYANSEVDTEPAAVVMPVHSEIPQPPLDIQSTPLSTTEPVIDVELPNPENAVPQSNSNWLDNLNPASGAAIAGGAVAGAGLWSRFASNNEPSQPTDATVQPELTASDNTEIVNIQSEEPAEATVLQQPNQQQNLNPLPDVWEDAEQEETQISSNWLDKISSAGNDALKGGAAVAGGAALWSQFANRDQHDNDNQDVPENNSLQGETAEVTSVPEVEIASQQPDVEIGAVDSSEVIETIYIEADPVSLNYPQANPTPFVEETTATQQSPNVSPDDSQETPTGSSWLDNIRSTSQSTLAGGAALAGGTAAVGAGLWSQFANRDNNDEPTNETNQTNEIVVDSGEQDLAASVNIPEVVQPDLVQPNIEVGTHSVVLPDLVQPTVDIGTAEVIQPNLVQPTVDINTGEIVQPNLVQPNIELATQSVIQPDLVQPTVDIGTAEVVQPDLVQPTSTEQVIDVEDTSEVTPQSDSNWLGNIGATGAAITGGAVVGSGFLSSGSTAQESNDSNQENIIESSNVTDNILSSVEASEDEILEAEVVDTDLNSDNDTESTQAQIIDPQPVEQPQTDTITTNTESTSTPDLNINPVVLAGGAAVAGAAFVAGNYNHGQKIDENVISQTPVADATPTTPTTDEVTAPVSSATTSHITFTTRTPKWAYVAWNITEQDKQAKRKEGAEQLALRLYDTTDTDLSYQTPQLVQQYECEETINDRFVAIPGSDRDYMAEIGYLKNDNHWLSIARSHIVRVFSRPFQEFWFEADAELIIHGATEPGSTVTIGGQSLKLKPDGTFHLRIPFTDELIDYVMTAVAKNGEKAKTIHMHFEQNK